MKKQSIALILVFVFALFGTAAAAFLGFQMASASAPPHGRLVSLASNPALPFSQVSPGDPERGRELFMGTRHFVNDGPPCMGCHNVDSEGLLGGGALGPDLTNVVTRLGEDGLQALLANIVFPTMRPIFKQHALTAQEQADLVAFLVTQAGKPETNREGLVIGLSVVGTIAAVVLIGYAFRRRLRGVRSPLVQTARAKK